MSKHYFTSSQVYLLINSYLIDEAHTINYEIMDDRTPVYGFRSEQFDAMSFGRTLVYGTLDINFTHRGYLFQVLARATTNTSRDDWARRHEVNRYRTSRSEMLGLGIDPRKLLDETARAEFLNQAADKYDLPEFDNRRDAMKDEFWGKSTDRGKTDKIEKKLKDKDFRERLFAEIADGRNVTGYANEIVTARPGALTVPVDMSIVYGDDPTDPLLREDIKRVYFKGQVKLVSASPQGSDTPILERYQFIAATIV